jgi:hypothetical protein
LAKQQKENTMNQAPVVNAQVISAIEVLTKAGHLTMEETCDIYKKMILSNVNPVQLATMPAHVAIQPVAAPVIEIAQQDSMRRRTRTVMRPDVLATAIAKIKLGVDCLEVARDAKVSEGTIRRVCKEHKLKYTTRYGISSTRVSTEEKKQIKQMLNAGISIVEIQIGMNVSASLVSLCGRD